MYRIATPLSKLIEATDWPVDFFSNDDVAELVDSIYIADYSISVTDGDISASVTLLLPGEFNLNVPGIAGLTFALGVADIALPPPGEDDISDEPLPGDDRVAGPEDGFPFDEPLPEGWFPLSLYFSYVDNRWSLSYYDLSAELRIDSNLLSPIDESGQISLGLRGEYALDDLFNLTFELLSEFDFPTCEIGNSGLILSAEGIKLDFSRQESPQEILDAGYDASFLGLYLESVSVQLPESLTNEDGSPITISGTDVIIGNGGISGTVSIEDTISARLFGFELELTDISITFSQNTIVASSLNGILTIPFFDEPFEISLSIGNNGDFYASLGQSDADGLFSLTIPNIGTLKIASIGFETSDGEAQLIINGSLQLTVLSPTLNWPEISLSDLRINPDGTIQLSDGWMNLQEPVSLSLFGFGFDMSRIGFGNENDGRPWIGFSGGLQLLPALPTGASVEGLRIIWDPEQPSIEPEIRLQGVGMEFTVPNAVSFSGDVALITDGPDRYFQGNASLEIMPIGLQIGASIKVGRNTEEDYKYLYLYSDLSLPVGIPLFATGAAIYGFSGLYGMNVGPTTVNGDWYGWYKNTPEPFNITHSSKWKGLNDGKALGAGMTLGTLFDAGTVVSAKGLFALIQPGPAIILNGSANFLSGLPNLNEKDSEGVFNMLAVLDALAGTLQLNIDAGWSKAQVLDIAASAEAYFNFSKPENWHFYLGQDEPEDRRIRAYMVSLFHADAYLMIDRNGIATGASISWGADWKFGPVKVILKAWIGGDATISFKPQQLAGSLNVGGEFEVSVAGVGLGLAAEAILRGAAPTQYEVVGQLILRVKLPTPIKDLQEDILLEWKEEKAPGYDSPLQTIGIEHHKADEAWNNLPESEEGSPVVPLDAKPFVVFDRPMLDETLTENIDLTSTGSYPGSTQIDSYSFDYKLKEVILEKKSKAGGESWTRVEDLYGTWIAEEDESGTEVHMKFQLWTKSPFAFTRHTSRTYRDTFLQNHLGWPCTSVPEVQLHCVDWNDFEPDINMPTYFEHQNVHFSLVSIEPGDFEFATIRRSHSSTSHCNQDNVLLLPSDGEEVMWITFPEPVSIVELCIGGHFVAIGAYSNGTLLERIINPQEERIGFSAFDYEGQAIDTIAVWGSDDPEIAQICYYLESEVQEYGYVADHFTSVFSNILRWDTSEEIFEPETYYRLTVIDETVRTHKGESVPEVHNNVAYFQTAGPPGITPAWSLNGPDSTSQPGENTTAPYPLGGALTDLTSYIKWTIPANGAQPVYRSYDLGADFNENYVEQMYGADMAVKLLDTNANPVLDENGNEIAFPNLWGEQPIAELSETEYPYTVSVEDCLEGYPVSYLPDQKILFANGILLEEDFSGDLENWTDPNATNTSAWEIKEGTLIYGTLAFPSLGALLVAGDESWSDYAIEVELSNQGEEVGLVCRHTEKDEQTYYRLRLSPTGRLFEKIIDAEVTVLWEDKEAYLPGEHSTLALQCSGDRLRGQLDQVMLFDLTDNDPLLEGRVGIYTNSTATFNHFLVREWPGGALAPQTMFQADLVASFVLFQGGLLDGWIDPTYSSWTELHKKDGIARLAALGRTDWDDYRLEINMERVGSRVGAIVRYQEVDLGNGQSEFNCYRLQINLAKDKIILDRFYAIYDNVSNLYEGQSATTLAECSGISCPIDFLTDSFDIALECIGNSLTAWVNGQLLFQIKDNNPLSTGQAGLYYLGNEVQGEIPVFSELVVRSATRQPVYSWNFTTSRYEGFVEHMDSFQGIVYREEVTDIDQQELEDAIHAAVSALSTLHQEYQDARAVLEGSNESVVSNQRENVLLATEIWHKEAHLHYDAIHKILLNSTHRPLPPCVELSEVTEDTERYGLLLESPEPLDWSRTNLQLAKWDASLESYEAVRDITMVWSNDATRVYLLPYGQGRLDTGRYVIQMAYNLDIGLEGPLQRRGGSVLPETTGLTFELT